MKKRKWKLFPLILALAMVVESTLSSVGNWSINEVQAASKPGEALYYAERWAECEAKVDWTETGLTQWSGGATQPTKGSGTVGSPYEVYNADQLRWCMVNQKSCKLMSDIDLGGRNSRNWTGIEIDSAMTIDGNGKTIYNLYSVATDRAGLIRRTTNSGICIKNLTMISSSVTTTDTGFKYGATMIADYLAGDVIGCTVKDALVNGSNGSTSGMGGIISALATCNKEYVYGGNIKDTVGVNVNVFGKGCCSGFVEGLYLVNGSMLVENCGLVDSTVISTGGHSGGFTSCIGTTAAQSLIIRNCYTNVDVYANQYTGVFCGVTHTGSNILFENCYASGKIEGVDCIGGFIGSNGNAGTGQKSDGTTFKNCYATSMVGMSNGGKNMGGFVGYSDSGYTFTNCYATGEVGTLNSDPNTGAPTDGSTNLGGFCGYRAGGTFNNCYYDKQTSGMREIGVGAGASTGITGLLTEELVSQNIDGDAWVRSSAGYPELKVFAESESAIDKAYSQASVSTVFLYANENDTSDYDTVRRIRYVFPMTSDKLNTGRSDYHIQWNVYEGEDPENPLFPNKSPLVEGDVKILTLSNTGTEDQISSVAPGVGWLQVNATYGGVTGMRRMRLVPTTSIAMTSSANAVMGSDATIYTVPENPPEGHQTLTDAQTKYDHRDGISFVTTNSTTLNNFITDGKTYTSLGDKLLAHNIKAKEFPKNVVPTVKTIDGKSVLVYELGSEFDNDRIMIWVSHKDLNGDTYEASEWTEELIKIMTGESTVDTGESGMYQLKYEWTDSTGNTLKAQSSKTLTILDPVEIVYNWNSPESEEGAYAKDQTGYTYGQTATLPEAPEREGYTFLGWSTKEDGFGENGEYRFNEGTALKDGKLNVYAIWKLNYHNLILKERGETESTDAILDQKSTGYGENVLEQLKTMDIRDKNYPQGSKLIGYTTDRNSWTPNVDVNTVMPDEDLVVYPIWGVDPEVGKTVVNTSRTEDNYVGDGLEYVLTAKNKALDSKWQNVTFNDRLPNGISLVSGSVILVSPDGTEIPLADTEVYNEETHSICYEVGDIYGNETYSLKFKAIINSNAIDPSETEEGKANRDISNTGEFDGTDSDGGEIGTIKTEPVTPNAGESEPDGTTTPGTVTPYDPEPSVTKQVKNETAKDSDITRVNDVLVYTLTTENLRKDSAWNDVTLQDYFPSVFQLVPNSIQLEAPDGTITSIADEDAYDEQKHAIIYKIGNIYGNEIYKLTFKLTVKVEATEPGADTGNVAGASGYTPWGRPSGTTSGTPVYPSGAEGGTVYWGTPDGHVYKNGLNLSRTDAGTKVGDRVAYVIKATNEASGSLWKDLVIYDEIPEGVEIDLSTIVLTKPNGEKISVSADAYDPETRILAVHAGQLYNVSSVELYFEAVITMDAYGADIGNVGYVTGSSDGPGEPSGTKEEWGTPYKPEGKPELPKDAVISEISYPGGGDGEGGVFPQNPEPELDKTMENVTNPGKEPEIKDVLSYEVALTNPTPNSLWKNIFIFDYLPDGLSLDTKSLTLTYPDGKTVALGKEVYDRNTHMIMVPISELWGGETYVLRYEAQVVVPSEPENVGKPIVNVAEATGENPDGTTSKLAPTASVSFEYPANETPNTGDNHSVGLWMVICVAALGMGCLTWRRKRKIMR